MKKNKNFTIVLLIVSIAVFIIAFVFLVLGEFLAARFDVIGIRVATLFVAFASFCSSTLFSFLIMQHNKMVNAASRDAEKRAEDFREIQFTSSNYSIIEFMDRMLVYEESERYITKYIKNYNAEFHMIESSIDEADIFENPNNYLFFSFKIPFRVIEGKVAAKISFDRLKFARDEKEFIFITPHSQDESIAYILYNERTKRKNVIINLVVKKDSNFFDPDKINYFSKIKIHMSILSLLGVKVTGVSELYFTNPEQIEGDGTNTYRINSSNFIITGKPEIIDSYIFD